MAQEIKKRSNPLLLLVLVLGADYLCELSISPISGVTGVEESFSEACTVIYRSNGYTIYVLVLYYGRQGFDDESGALSRPFLRYQPLTKNLRATSGAGFHRLSIFCFSSSGLSMGSLQHRTLIITSLTDRYIDTNITWTSIVAAAAGLPMRQMREPQCYGSEKLAFGTLSIS